MVHAGAPSGALMRTLHAGPWRQPRQSAPAAPLLEILLHVVTACPRWNQTSWGPPCMRPNQASPHTPLVPADTKLPSRLVCKGVVFQRRVAGDLQHLSKRNFPPAGPPAFPPSRLAPASLAGVPVLLPQLLELVVPEVLVLEEVDGGVPAEEGRGGREECTKKGCVKMRVSKAEGRGRVR